MIKIAVDCYGGDRGPEVCVNGALSALSLFPDLYIIFTGDSVGIASLLGGRTYDTSRVEVIHAPEVIGCDEKPTDAIRLKRESSMMKAVNLLRGDDGVSGMVSCGSTGALVAAAIFRIGRGRGVIRPAFCPVLPTMNGGVVGICDSGANIECTAEELRQFAVMGSIYLETVYPDRLPGGRARVALLNVGTEAEKGDSLRRDAYALLSDTPEICFAGNMESRELLKGDFDLVVCDGFSGNVLVKSTEGACLEMLKLLKKDMLSGLRNKIGALFLKPMLMKEKEFMNYQNYGGSVMLGANKIIVKGHGSSKEKAVEVCITQAYRMASARLCEKIEEKICSSAGQKGQ